ncbi:MgtC/SapB family protein [Candidatus Margulisiibacteriota bacterium]
MSEWEMIIKLFLACLFGAAFGFSREKERKAAGLRTHILVSLGSTLFTMVSIFVAQQFPGSDSGRIASSIVTGIGFIGAGTILQAGKSIIGTTTAASIWTTAAIGMALGFGFYEGAAVATILGVVVLTFLHDFEVKYIRDSKKD